MSMISAQCDELRAMAESVGLAVPQAATLMMEAADTIWELRDSVHRERAEADRLRELLAKAGRLLPLADWTNVRYDEMASEVMYGIDELGIEVE